MRLKNRYFLILVLSVFFAGIHITDYSKAQSGHVLWEEDFNDNSADWRIVDSPTAIARMNNDSFELAMVTRNNTRPFFVTPGDSDWSDAPQFTAPYEIEFSAAVRTGNDEICLLAYFNVQEDDGNLTYNHFSYCTDDSGDVSWTITDDELGEDSGTPEEPVSLIDGQMHNFRLQVNEDSVTVWIDDTEVAESDNVANNKGSIGFGIAIPNPDSNIQIAGIFRNLLVYGDDDGRTVDADADSSNEPEPEPEAQEDAEDTVEAGQPISGSGIGFSAVVPAGWEYKAIDSQFPLGQLSNQLRTYQTLTVSADIGAFTVTRLDVLNSQPWDMDDLMPIFYGTNEYSRPQRVAGDFEGVEAYSLHYSEVDLDVGEGFRYGVFLYQKFTFIILKSYMLEIYATEDTFQQVAEAGLEFLITIE